jgi:transposase
MTRIRRAFTPEFKQEAVRRVTDRGRTLSQVAREVGVRPEQMRLWKKELLAEGIVARPAHTESAEDELRGRESGITSIKLTPVMLPEDDGLKTSWG